VQNYSTSQSVLLDEAVNKIKLPYTTLEGIWRKATLITTETNAVVRAPGFGDKDKMVKSTSGSAPHLIKVSDCQYLCDSQCPQFKSVNICSHVVAVAETNGDLVDFVNWFCTRHSYGTTPNLMKLASHGMPPGTGNKDGKAQRKKVKSKQVPPVALNTSLQSQIQILLKRQDLKMLAYLLLALHFCSLINHRLQLM